MNQRIVITLLVVFNVLLIAVVLFFTLFNNEKKLVYVDTGKLVGEFQGMKAAEEMIEKHNKVVKGNIDTLASDLQQEIKKYEKERGRMSAKERKLSEDLLRTKQQQFMQYQQVAEQKAIEEGDKIRQKVLDQMNGFIKDYGQKKSYQIILGATFGGNIVYAEDNLDITEEVLKELNQMYKAKK